MTRPRTMFRIFAACLLAAATLSACGSGEPDATTSRAPRPANATAADQSLAPVVVGFRNLEGGAISLPDLRVGFESAVEYVNTELGGINGHPLKAVICKTDVTPESSVNCANRFVSEKVVLATQGVDFGADAALPILQKAGIADTSAFPYGPAWNTAVGDTFASEASAEEGYAAGLVQLSDMGAKKVAVVLADVPSNHQVMDDVVKPVAARLAGEVSPFFYPAPADWTSLGATILASNPDAILFFGVDADCVAAVPAFRSLGFTGLIQAGICSVLAERFEPSALKNVIVGNPFYNETMHPIPAGVQADLDVFARFIADDRVTNRGQAMQGFHVGTWIADLLRQVEGEQLTAASVKTGIKSAKGRLFFRDKGYDCASPTWPGSSACGSGFLFTKVNDEGRNEVLADQPVDISGVRPAS